MGQSLLPEDVQPRLRGRFGHHYAFVDRCESTQRLLDDADEGSVVAADEQTEGRGRMGRRWEAPAGTSLLFSLRLHPPVETAKWPELSVVAGQAVAEAITHVTGLEAQLKHPNDVLVGGKKVAGVLAEAREGRVVVGIGINISQTADQLPKETAMPPTSLGLEAHDAVDRAGLLVAALESLEQHYDDWVSRAEAAD